MSRPNRVSMTNYKARNQPQLTDPLLKSEALESHMLEQFKDEIEKHKEPSNNMPATKTRGQSSSQSTPTVLRESPHNEICQWSTRHRWLCHMRPSVRVTLNRQNSVYKETFLTGSRRLGGYDGTYSLPSSGSSLRAAAYKPIPSPFHLPTSPPFSTSLPSYSPTLATHDTRLRSYSPTSPAGADISQSYAILSSPYTVTSPAFIMQHDRTFLTFHPSSLPICEETLYYQNVAVPQRNRFGGNNPPEAYHRTYPGPGTPVPSYLWVSYPSCLSIGCRRHHRQQCLISVMSSEQRQT